MPRKPRHFVPGEVYHLISRFVDREWFIREEHERRLYLELLGAALSGSDWRCIAFAIMSNHIHLATIAGTQTLDSWIRCVHSPFADTMNRQYDRIGPMFVRGPKAIAVDATGVGSVVAYIHNNPVRAKVVGRASESTWTSHRAYLGHVRAPEWLHVDEGLALSQFSDPTAFDQWVQDPTREAFDDVYERVVIVKEPPPFKPRPAVEPERIVAVTAWELGIPLSQLRSPRRGPAELLGRATVVYCAERVGVRGADTARALGVTQQAVSKMRRRGFDELHVRLGEQVLARLMDGMPDTSCTSCV